MEIRVNPKSWRASRRNSLRNTLLGWYDAHRRDLPWRKSCEPYQIWVSEIMLQQTRVAAVLEYYRKFLLKFPTVQSLAKADLQDVLTAWSGLGYYRRARSMHAAAKEIVARGGVFPTTLEGLRELPGIGRYTAAAVASIAFQYPAAVVDGNVERVLSRICGIRVADECAWKFAEELLSIERPGDWNQAMMELGATVCTPVSPSCGGCPVRRLCKLKGAEPATVQPQRYKKEVIFGVERRGRLIRLVQRSNQESLMAGMWELPSAESRDSEPVLLRVKHSITNSDYSVTVVERKNKDASEGRWIAIKKLGDIPLTGVARKILRKLKLLPESAPTTS